MDQEQTPPPAAPQPVTPTPQPQQAGPEVPKKKLSPLLIAGIAGAVFIVLLAIIGIIVGLSIIRNSTPVTPTPSETPTPIPSVIEIVPVQNPKYASDSAFLKLRDDLKSLNQQIGTANFFEPEIAPPSINLKIQIEN